MKKSVVLVAVIGVMLVITTLVMVALYVMTQQSRIAEHKIKRLRAFYAAQAGIVSALEELRKRGTVTTNPVNVGSGISGYPSGGYAVDINVTTVTGTGTILDGLKKIDATVNY
jgi:Tfp pilus assembly protein PilX